jgi:acyl-CoA thioesterase-1
MGFFLNLKNMNRRHCIALTAGLALARNSQTLAATPGRAAEAKILVLGDSLSAEYGLKRGNGWVALLEKKLGAEKLSATVVNASISGDTTAGGLTRLPPMLLQHKPSLVVIELGANDALRGLPLAITQDNLNAMSQAAQAAGARVLLLGMQLPPNYGRDYGARFTSMYAEVAKTRKTGLVPFMLHGVADVPDSARWFQGDRIHPVDAAHPLILDNIWPELKKALK